MRLTSAAALLACLSSCASASSIATGEGQAGQQPREDRTAAAGSSLPPGLGFLRALGGECRSCLKECLGTQATALQQASLRWQAPISLVTWRARTPPSPPSPLSPKRGSHCAAGTSFAIAPSRCGRSRRCATRRCPAAARDATPSPRPRPSPAAAPPPPRDGAPSAPLQVVYNALKVHPAVWGSLAAGGYMSCSSQCDAECPFPGQRYDPSGPAMRELEEIDAADTSWLMRLYRQGGSRGGGSRGGIQDTLGTLFQL